ncbi:MAG: N-acetylmuramoyl-L-alanine amidase [Oscillospiraceae bacterium]
MPYKKKQGVDQKKLMLIVAIVATTLILVVAGLFAFFTYKNDKEAKAAAALDALPRIVVPAGHFAPVSYTSEVKKNIKAITLRPKIDIYKDIKADQKTLEAEVDKVIADVKSLSFNSIILDTRLDDSVVFASSTLSSTPVDLLSILLKKASEKEINVAVIYNLTGVKNKDGELIDSFLPYKNRQTIADAMSELAVYEVAAIQMDNYYPKKNGASFAEYQSYGSVGEYPAWLKDNVNAVIDEVINQTKLTKPTLPIGLCVSSVWANAGTVKEGSPTKAEFESLVDGYADTKALVESGAVDFIDVKVPTSTLNSNESFTAVVNWWGKICKTAQMPMYITHSGESATNAKLQGWSGTAELPRQVSVAVKSGNYYGSTFTGLSTLMANPNKSTDYLKKCYTGEIPEKDIFQGIEVISPKRNTVTYEENIQIKLKFDPNADVLLNDKKVEASSRGGASIWVPLKVGKNAIKLEHKGESTIFNVERKVVIFKEVSPKGAIKVAGSSTIELSVLAYKDSKITATINGKTITLTEGGGGDENNAESAYRVYQAQFTVPKATAKDQSIGTIKFNGNYQGVPQPAKGATITIEKLADEVDPDSATGQIFTHAIVTSRYANVFPYKTTGFPQAIDYQLPSGTQDIVVSENGNYLNLRSGKTVLKSDVTLQDIAFEGNNPIAKMTAGVEGNDTVIRAQMSWKSPFSINLSPYANYSTSMGKKNYQFNGDSVTILLDYGTTLKPENFSGDMSGSPIFAGISHKRIKNEAQGTWQYQITLPLKQAGRYYGAHATWEDNTLVIRFNHPPASGSLSGLKIAVDAGHGGKDTGNTAGRDSVEKDLNLEYSFKLQASLQAMGAEVFMIRESDTTVDNHYRVDMAEANGCDLYIAVHQNSSGVNPNAYGVQTYYNAPFSQPLAQIMQASLENVAPASQWNYWNGSQSSYNFIVTRERQFPSILVECGFLSNNEDEARALDPSYQQSLVDAMVQGILNYYSAYN